MGVLGARPLLVGRSAPTPRDYLRLAVRPRRRRSAVRTSETLATARFTCTTDQDHAQLATFYPGRHGRGRADRRRALGELDLVVVAPDDPGAMLRHSASCRDRGVPVRRRPVAAAGLHGRRGDPRAGRGATYLFTNEYEAGLVHEKTGWSPDDVLARVGTRVTTHGAGGIVVERRGGADPAGRRRPRPARSRSPPASVTRSGRAS
jgi:adenosine kinase